MRTHQSQAIPLDTKSICKSESTIAAQQFWCFTIYTYVYEAKWLKFAVIHVRGLFTGPWAGDNINTFLVLTLQMANDT